MAVGGSHEIDWVDYYEHLDLSPDDSLCYNSPYCYFVGFYFRAALSCWGVCGSDLRPSRRLQLRFRLWPSWTASHRGWTWQLTSAFPAPTSSTLLLPCLMNRNDLLSFFFGHQRCRIHGPTNFHRALGKLWAPSIYFGIRVFIGQSCCSRFCVLSAWLDSYLVSLPATCLLHQVINSFLLWLVSHHPCCQPIQGRCNLHNLCPTQVSSPFHPLGLLRQSHLWPLRPPALAALSRSCSLSSMLRLRTRS